MSWDNYGINGWEIDHIIPCAIFDLTDYDMQRLCFCYLNLQPLWNTENWQKHDSWSYEIIDELLPKIMKIVYKQ
jgi:hypothetical protein